jgi:hypothetical protein
MTPLSTIAVLEQRISKAQTRRDIWRASGSQESYMEACTLVDALELQLERALSRPGEPMKPPY